VAHQEEFSAIVKLLHDARGRRDGWPNSLGRAEAAGLAALLRVVPVLDLASMIDWTFDPYEYEYRQRPPRDAKRWRELFDTHASTPESWAWFAISTLDRSGFVRQAAVEALGHHTPVEAIPFVVLRTTDWVLQVRTAAEGVLQQCLSDMAPSALLSSLEVALHAEERIGPPRLAGARAVLERLRAAPDDVLVAGVGREAARSQRWCLRELIARRSSLLPDALRAALRSSSTALRFEAAAALGQVPHQARAELLDVALEDRVGFVRRGAAEAVPASELREDELERLLLDLNRAARAVAQREWQRRTGTSAAALYRNRLGARRAAARAAALLGLAEVGNEDDAAEAVVRLEDPSRRVRLMALRCIGRLAPTEAETAALEALDDPSHKVVSAAASIALQHPSPRMQAKVEQLLSNADVSRRKTGLRLLRVGDLVWQAQMLDKFLRIYPVAQAEALLVLEKLVTRRLMGRTLPQQLRNALIATVTELELRLQVGYLEPSGPNVTADVEIIPIDEWERRRREARLRDRLRRAEKLRARIVFALKSTSTV
jgi:HEAT repeat protein